MSTTSRSSAPIREPHLLKFRLRQMFSVVTLACLLCALVAITSGPWPWVIALSAVMMAAHVFGNLIGTRLRETSQDVVRWRNSDPSRAPDVPQATSPGDLERLPMPTHPNLANFGRLISGLKWYLIGGSSAGFLFGATIIELTIGQRIGLAGWVVGAISGAVLGTWAAFLAVSFTTIARDAWRQAHDK